MKSVYYLDVRDYTTKFPATIGAGGAVGGARKIYDVGTTDLTNRELMDQSDNGKGVLRSLWTDPNGPFQGRYEVGVSDCEYKSKNCHYHQCSSLQAWPGSKD